MCVKFTGAEVGSKVVEKASPAEKVGVYTQTGPRDAPMLAVTEYSELTEADAMAMDSDGGLRFRWSNLAMHYFSVDFMDRMVVSLAAGAAAAGRVATRDGFTQC